MCVIIDLSAPMSFPKNSISLLGGEKIFSSSVAVTDKKKTCICT